MLCFDIYTEVEEYQFLVDMSLRMIECYKTLVDCFFDFGQWSTNDSPSTVSKPWSPFSRILDSCSLSSTQQVTWKNYQPLLNDATRIQYLVGSGNYDESCFPGNILIGLIDWDHNAALARAGGPVVESQEDLLKYWKVVLMKEYVKPMYVKFVQEGFGEFMEFLGGVQPENERTTILEHDASDYLPIKETTE